MSWSSFGKKVFSGASKAVRLGAKYSGVVESVASKVASGAGAAAIGAAALGLEPIAAGLGAVAGAALGVEKGANMIHGGLDKAEEVSGVMRSGVERIKKADKKGGVRGKIDMGKAGIDTLRSLKRIRASP